MDKYKNSTMKYNIDKELMHDSSIKTQSILILIVIMCSLISAIYFYNEAQNKNKELGLTINELTNAKTVLEEKENKILNIQDSLLILIEKLNKLNTDSIFLVQARKLIQESNNISLSAISSSHLVPSKLNTYYANNAVDGNPNSPWVEGGKGYGIGEYLKISFNKESSIKGLRIINGYNFSKPDGVGNRFFKNSRVKKANLRFSDGSTESIELKDTNEFQTIYFSERKTSYVVITIEDVYKGSKWEDTCISEVGFVFLI